MHYLLERATTEFSALEDRIKLVGQVKGEGAVSILITRRLLQLLLPKLLLPVEGRVGMLPKVQSASGDTGKQAGYEKMHHEFAQLAANEELVPLPPVKEEQGGPTILPSSIYSKIEDSKLLLIFADDSGTMAHLAFDETQLRQWLQMLYIRAERDGAWQLSQWPTWLDGAKLAEVPSGLVVH